MLHSRQKTDIEFTDYEFTLLNNGLQYVNHKQKNCIGSHALEAETALTQVPTHELDHMRCYVANYITRLCKQQEEEHTNKATHIKY